MRFTQKHSRSSKLNKGHIYSFHDFKLQVESEIEIKQAWRNFFRDGIPIFTLHIYFKAHIQEEGKC